MPSSVRRSGPSAEEGYDGCIEFATLDAGARRPVITAPPPAVHQNNPLDQLLPLIMQLAPLAAMAL
jgi:hypothetical protein